MVSCSRWSQASVAVVGLVVQGSDGCADQGVGGCVASIDRTAYPRFKRVVSGRELAESFTPSDVEVEWARSRTTTDLHVLVLLVWLKSYQRLGYFPKLADVPEVVVVHVSSAAGMGSGVVAVEHDSPRTAKWHRQLIREYFGVVYEPARVRAVAEAAIRAAAQTKDNPADLINVALEELVRSSCEPPGYTTLDAMTATIRTEVNTGFYPAVAARISPLERARLAWLLLADPVTRRSEFDRLKDPAKKASLGKFRQRLEHLAALDGLGASEQWLGGIPSGKIGHFAGEARVTDVALTPRELSEQLNLTTGSVTVMLDRLEKLDLHVRAPHPVDMRKVVIRATDEGARRCFDLVGPLISDSERELASKYDLGQLRLVIDFLHTNTAVQQRHVDRLRDRPTPSSGRRRTGAR